MFTTALGCSQSRDWKMHLMWALALFCTREVQKKNSILALSSLENSLPLSSVRVGDCELLILKSLLEECCLAPG